jgi:hypothetical protein
MTTNTTDTNVSQLAPTADSTEVVEKQSFVAKTKAFVKNHKKSTIAVGALVGLVGVSALVGRKTAPSTDFDEPSEESLYEAEVALAEMGIPTTDS